MTTIPALEVHVSHACNLSCESCSHFSNHGHKGKPSARQLLTELQPWASRLAPKVIRLLGGEPMLNPELCEIIASVRGLWPASVLQMTTNGLLAKGWDDGELLKVLLVADCHVHLSIHSQDEEYQQKLMPTWGILERWQLAGITVSTEDMNKRWTRRYKGYGPTSEPYEDNQPEKSWSICPAREAMQVFEGKLWKCSPIAYLQLQKRKYGETLSAKWDPYLAYVPLEPTATDEELQGFVSKRAEPICCMCPAKPEPFQKPNPLHRNTIDVLTKV